MRSNVVRSYEDTVVETRSRLIVEIQDAYGTVEVWHGGRHLADMGCFTSVAAAIKEAVEVAGNYGVTDKSSLVIRVSEKVTLSRHEGNRNEPRELGKAIGSPVSVRERHAFDFRRGEIVHRTVEFPWLWPIPVGFNATDDDPGDVLPEYFTPIGMRYLGRRDFLYDGFGHGEMKVLSKVRRTAVGSDCPGNSEFRRAPHRAVVEVRGITEILMPPETSDEAALESLVAEGIEVSFEIDWNRGNRAPSKWIIMSGAPASSITWSLPGAV